MQWCNRPDREPARRAWPTCLRAQVSVQPLMQNINGHQEAHVANRLDYERSRRQSQARRHHRRWHGYSAPLRGCRTKWDGPPFPVTVTWTTAA